MKTKTDAELIAEAEKLALQWGANYGPFGPDDRFETFVALSLEIAKRLKAANKQLALDRPQLRLLKMFREHVQHENHGSMCEKEYTPCELCYPEAYEPCEGDVI